MSTPKQQKTKNKITNKITFNYLTSFEKTLILGHRTQQIEHGSPILINVNTLPITQQTPENIAREELKQKKIPYKIKRNLPNGKYEIWDIEDLLIL